MRLAPDFAEAWYQRGLLYLAWEKIETALSDFEAGVRADGNHLQSREQAAAIHHQLGNTEQAMAGWRGVLALNPNDVVARRRLQQCEQRLTTT